MARWAWRTAVALAVAAFAVRAQACELTGLKLASPVQVDSLGALTSAEGVHDMFTGTIWGGLRQLR